MLGILGGPIIIFMEITSSIWMKLASMIIYEFMVAITLLPYLKIERCWHVIDVPLETK